MSDRPFEFSGINHLALVCRDMQRTVDFYEGVLGFTVTDVQHDGRIVWLAMGGTTILLRPGEPPRSDRYVRGGPALILYTDDLAATLAAFAARGATPCGDDGPGCPLFRDPDGNWIQVVDPRHQ